MGEELRLRFPLAVAAALASAISTVALLLIFPETKVDSLELIEPQSGWFLLTNLISSAVYLWRFDPLTQTILSTLGSAGVFGFYSAIFAFGSALFIPSSPFFSVLILSTLISLFSGFDTALWGTVAWYPLIIGVLGSSNKSRATLLLLPLLSIGMAYGSGSLALVLALLAVLHVTFSAANRITAAKLSILFLPILVIIFTSPFPDLGSYPPFARTFAETSLLGGLDPLIGSAPPIRLIDRAFVEQANLFLIVLIALILLCDFVFYKSKRRDPKNNLAGWMVLALLASLIFDSSIMPEKLQVIGPLYSISRMIPGLVLFPLAPWAGTLTLFYLLWFLSLRPWNRNRLVIHLVIILVTGLFQVNCLSLKGSSRKILDSLKDLTLDEREWAKGVIHSSSFPLLKRVGIAVLARAKASPALIFLPLSNFRPELTASHSVKRLATLLDGEEETRWSPSKGRQDGDEWIQLKFGRMRTLRGLRILSGKFHSDFARGIEISVSESCDSDESSVRPFHVVARESEWLGVIVFTPTGLPYLRSQSEVELTFKDTPMQCLLIKQVAKDSHYDWSVTKIEVALRE